MDPKYKHFHFFTHTIVTVICLVFLSLALFAMLIGFFLYDYAEIADLVIRLDVACADVIIKDALRDFITYYSYESFNMFDPMIRGSVAVYCSVIFFIYIVIRTIIYIKELIIFTLTKKTFYRNELAVLTPRQNLFLFKLIIFIIFFLKK
jgi:hypothetical protein